jgi:hypothetical protein
MMRSSRPKGGQHDTNIEEDYRDMRSGVVRRQRSLGSPAAGKPCTEGFAITSVHHGPKDLATVIMPYPTATHYRHAHLILESTTPGQRGGSYSKQGCSTDAQSVGGGYGRWLIFETCTRGGGGMAGKAFQRGGMSASLFCVIVLAPPTIPRGDEGPRLGGES